MQLASTQISFVLIGFVACGTAALVVAIVVARRDARRFKAAALRFKRERDEAWREINDAIGVLEDKARNDQTPMRGP